MFPKVIDNGLCIVGSKGVVYVYVVALVDTVSVLWYQYIIIPLVSRSIKCHQCKFLWTKRLVVNPDERFSDTNRALQPHKVTRGLKFRI